MRLIDAKQLEKQVKKAFETQNPVLMGQMLRWIRKQKTIDAVPVVRCENCHHGEPCGDEIACLHPELVMETDGCTPIRKKDFFCAFGETTEGADNEP